MFDPLGSKQTEQDKTELTNIIRVAMQKGQSYFLIHFELVGLFGPRGKRRILDFRIFFGILKIKKSNSNVLLQMKEFQADIFAICRPHGSYNILKVSVQTDVSLSR